MRTTDPATSGAGLNALLLLGDGRLPVGGFAQSGGLEPALHAGLDPAAIPGLIETRLRTASLVDAGTAVVAQHLLRTTGDPRPAMLAWEARTPSEVTRAASVEVGRGYGRLLERLGHPVPARPARPIAVAALCHAMGLSADSAARLICHDDIQSMGAAALKLVPGDPIDTVVWALGLAPTVEHVVSTVTHLTAPEDIPAASAPAAELWQHAHAHSTRRLFRA